MLFICLTNLLLGQDNQAFRHQVQINTFMDFSVNRYGFQAEYNKPIFIGDNQGYQFGTGAFNEFFIISYEGNREGYSGNTISNILGITASNSLNILKNRRLYISNTIYVGWGYRRTKINYTNLLYDIDRNFQSSYNYFALGAYWKLGYRFRENLGVHLIGKTDFSRLIDKYEPVFLQRPGFMYGIGITYYIK